MRYATTGQPAQARAALSTVLNRYRAMAMTFWLLEAEGALAQVEGLRSWEGSSDRAVLRNAQFWRKRRPNHQTCCCTRRASQRVSATWISLGHARAPA